MSFKEISLKKSYSSDFDDILHSFYIPILEKSVEYYRLAGFFSSTSLAIAAKGISGLIKNKGSMKLIVCPKLSKEDIDIILDAHINPEKYIESNMLRELDNIENEIIRDHVFALGWMIANNLLEINVALVYGRDAKALSYEETFALGIFHQKVGILKDKEGNIVTFSGSINETALGWLENIEEFKVFRSWVPEEEDYAKEDLNKFNRLWNNQSPKVKVIEIPDAVKRKLVSVAPKDINEINLERWYVKKPYTFQKRITSEKIELYEYQKRAVNSWLANKMRGIFEMATGTGKTFTALGCTSEVFKKEKKVILVVSCPYQHLIEQWSREIKKFGLVHDKIIFCQSGSKWKDELANSLIDVELGHLSKLIILTTHKTFSSEDFRNIFKKYKKNFKILVIADEVHWLGARKYRSGLIEEYDFRLGLSATPKRWFDNLGTETLYQFFGGTIFEFSLKDAIRRINPATGQTYLVPYKYIPKFVSLTENELADYISKTKSIAYRYLNTENKEERDEILELLLFRRAEVIKNASKKYEALMEILDELGSNIKHTIIYCTPQQIDRVTRLLSERDIIFHRFTAKEGTRPLDKYEGLSEREWLLKNFEEGEYQVLVAMKCLDEGVDVPPARTAILMASSGNPREYIQRIGRVIRRFPRKIQATIYDIIVIPSLEKDIPLELREIELKILEKELKRYEEIASISINYAEALNKILRIKNCIEEA